MKSFVGWFSFMIVLVAVGLVARPERKAEVSCPASPAYCTAFVDAPRDFGSRMHLTGHGVASVALSIERLGVTLVYAGRDGKMHECTYISSTLDSDAIRRIRTIVLRDKDSKTILDSVDLF